MILLPRRKLWRDLDRYCAIDVRNPGSGGGSSTVTTDGVTIQGDGSIGNPIALKQVETQARLTGAGTVASKLDIAGWPLPFFMNVNNNGNGNVPGANNMILWGVVIPFAVTFAHIIFILATADGSNNSDVGLYNASGNLIANIGAQHLGSTGVQSVATVQGAQTILPGLYFYGITSAAGTLNAWSGSLGAGCYYNNAFATTSGGAMNATITPPTLAMNANSPSFGLI